MAEVPVSERTYIALEESLTARLLGTWKPIGQRIANKVLYRSGKQDWDGVDEAIQEIDLGKALKPNKDYAKFVGLASMLFGVARLGTPRNSEFQKNGGTSDYVSKSVSQIGMSLDYSSTTLQKDISQKVSNARSLIAIQKADLLTGLATGINDSIVGGGGKIDVATSLHTSRLAQFGYTVEATLVGQITYMINAILDVRTCPVCDGMDQQVFSVSRLQERLVKVFNATSVEEIKRLAPWPKQDKASLERLESMTSEEIIRSGYDSPPYHPL